MKLAVNGEVDRLWCVEGGVVLGVIRRDIRQLRTGDLEWCVFLFGGERFLDMQYCGRC